MDWWEKLGLDNREDRRGFFQAIVVVTVLGFALLLVVGIPISPHLRGIGEAVCKGTPAEASAPYDPAASPPHRMVIMWDSVRSIRKREYPAGWLPSADSELELVACVSQRWETLQTCRYNIGPAISRLRATLTTRVVEARTGRTVDSFDLQWGEPPSCPEHAAVQVESVEGSVPSRREYLESTAQTQGPLHRLVQGQGPSGRSPVPPESTRSDAGAYWRR